MKNFEKCGKEMLSQLLNEMYGQDCRKVLKKVAGIQCADMNNCEKCGKTIFDILNAEYVEPIKLTHDEYVILKNLPEEIKYIARNSYRNLETYEYKPFRNCGLWSYIDSGNGVCRHVNLYAFNHLFQFIKWEDDEPYSIEQLIADYEKEHGDGN